MLLSILSQIVDPRKETKGNRKPPLVSILALIIIGFLCGHTGYTSIATWARNEPELAEAVRVPLWEDPVSRHDSIICLSVLI